MRDPDEIFGVEGGETCAVMDACGGDGCIGELEIIFTVTHEFSCKVRDCFTVRKDFYSSDGYKNFFLKFSGSCALTDK